MRMLIEVCETPNSRRTPITDSELFINKGFTEFATWRNMEKRNLQGCMTQEQWNDFNQKMLRLYAQFRKGMVTGGDGTYVDLKTSLGLGDIRYFVSFLEDAGRH